MTGYNRHCERCERAINLVITCQLTPTSPYQMVGKPKKTTLTKIDPRSLKAKPQVVSQHVTDDGIHVTTTINPVHDPPSVPPADTDEFSADLENLVQECLEDDSIGDDISRGYYVARVCGVYPPNPVFHVRDLPLPGQPAPTMEA